MSHRIRLALAATLALAALAGAELPAAAQTPKPGGTLRAAMRAEVSTYDPHKGASGSDHMYLYPVFDTLVRFDEKMTARPGLAESWETPDPKTLVLKLRKGVKFHDGTPFNAEAVRFNLARAQDKATSSMSSELTSIDKVEVVDEHTVRLA
jgi:ABC-type transport system substrate-binding protein